MELQKTFSYLWEGKRPVRLSYCDQSEVGLFYPLVNLDLAQKMDFFGNWSNFGSLVSQFPFAFGFTGEWDPYSELEILVMVV